MLRKLLPLLLLLCLAISPATATWCPPTDDSIYGVEWNAGDPSPTLRWIDRDGNTLPHPDFDNHVIWGNIKRVLLTGSGTVTRDVNPRGDALDLTGTSGKVMTEIPKFYVASEKSGNYYRWWISPSPATGFELHPAFRMRGGIERDYIYVGSYEATLRVLDDGTLSLDSRSGEQPWTGYSSNPRDGMFAVGFSGGSSRPAVGATVQGVTSGTSGQLVGLHVSSGSWDSKNAAGTLYLKQTSGSFTNAENLQVSGTAIATATTGTANAGIVATINDFEGWGNNIGSGWGAMNVWSLSAIRMLYLVEHATWASQETTGLGIVSKASGTGFAGEVTGFGNIDSLMGEYGTYGDTSGGLTSVSYRTLTDLWGNSWEWTTGYTSTNTQYQITKRDGTGSLATHPLAAGSFESSNAAPLQGSDNYVYGYWTSLVHEDLLQYLFLPNSVSGGSESTYGTDCLYSHNSASPGIRILLAGGDWSDGRYAGVGFLNANGAASNSYRYVGARLEFCGPTTLAGNAPIANVTRNATAGNAPLAVAFTDASAGAPSWWQWEFGDGTNSAAQNPVHTYNTPGTYTVSLTSYTIYGSDTATTTITVLDPPTANFTANVTAGNAPLSVLFADSSAGNVTAWSWDFGDGATSTEQNPVHAYVSEGVYTVSLTASNAYGSNTTAQADLIAVLAPPVANFTADDTIAAVGQTVSFTDTSTGNVTGWQWDFGDGQTSTSQHPTHAYAAAGVYNVTLTASNAYGSSTSTLQIDVGSPPTTAFSTNVTAGTAPLAVTFTDTSTGTVTGWSWDFGDGQTSTSQHPTHTYDTAGTYTVSLTASNAYGSSTETKTDLIVAHSPPVANFTADDTIAAVGQTVSFTDTSTGTVTAWSWNFGDGQTSTSQHPTHTYDAAGVYTVTLSVSSEYGSDTETKADYVDVGFAPVVYLSYNTSNTVAINQAISFGDGSAYNPTTRLWDFGDNTTSTEKDIEHAYSSVGTYTVTLTVSNKYGESTDTASFTVGYPPISSFYASPTISNPGVEISFHEACINTTSFWWIFGDGKSTTTRYATHTYSAPGLYTVELRAINKYGYDIETKIDYIDIGYPPNANFSANHTIVPTGVAVQFTDTSTENATAWSWDFGDGATSTAQHPTHTYDAAGVYTVTLTATNKYGESTKTQAAYIDVGNVPVAGFSTDDTTVAPGIAVQFTDASTNTPISWFWDFGDGSTSTSQNPTHAYSSPGTYTVTLTATNDYGASTAKVKADYIDVGHPPAAAFNVSDRIIATGGSVSFTDSSTNSPISWLWSFGDGTTSTEQNPVHAYSSIGTYAVSLTATNTYGSDTETKVGYINVGDAPTATFSADDTTVVAGATVSFMDTSTNLSSSWQWDFGDGQTSTAQNPTHSYSSVGTYAVTLTVTNPYGTDTETKTAYITVGYAPVAAFVVDARTISAGSTVTFTDLSTQSPTAYLWSFGDGQTSTTRHPAHTYNSPGTYTVTLTATNIYGSSTETKTGYITVGLPAPSASFATNMTASSPGRAIAFTDTSSGTAITSWRWSFGDGTTSTEQNPTHTYSRKGTFTVTLTISNSHGSNTASRTIIISDTVPYAGLRTNAATDLSTSSATFHGTVLTSQDTEVWFVYGTAPGTYAYTTGKQSSSGDFGGRQKGFPLVAGQTYYYRAACAQGCGDEMSFTLPGVTPRATTTYGSAGLELLQHSEEDKGYTALNDSGGVPASEGKDIFSAFYDAITAPYVALFGAFFFAMVIGGVFMNIALKGGSLFVPALLSIAGGSMLWGLLPPEAAVLGQSILIFGIAGFIFWLFTDRK